MTDIHFRLNVKLLCSGEKFINHNGVLSTPGEIKCFCHKLILMLVHIMMFQLKKLEEDIKPLQNEMREIESERDALRVEKKTVLAESERWKLRTNQLIEQAHKTDPEEHKKLMYVI